MPQRCTWCGYVYDPAAGDPARGVAPGTPFEALAGEWCCPDCRAPQADFAACTTQPVLVPGAEHDHRRSTDA